MTGERHSEGYRVKNGFGTIHQPWYRLPRHADLVWCETGVPEWLLQHQYRIGKTG